MVRFAIIDGMCIMG